MSEIGLLSTISLDAEMHAMERRLGANSIEFK